MSKSIAMVADRGPRAAFHLLRALLIRVLSASHSLSTAGAGSPGSCRTASHPVKSAPCHRLRLASGGGFAMVNASPTMPFDPKIPRELANKLGREAMKVIELGLYASPTSQQVDIAADNVKPSVYPADD